MTRTAVKEPQAAQGAVRTQRLYSRESSAGGWVLFTVNPPIYAPSHTLEEGRTLCPCECPVSQLC